MKLEQVSIFDVEAIHLELRRARRAATVSETAFAGAAATTMNFIVYVDDTERPQWVHDRALALAQKHPSRVLILDGSKDGCGVVVECERIELAVSDLEPEQVATLVHALSERDVPSVLWWTSRRIAHNDCFHQLSQIVDRVVVDTSGNLRDDDTLRDLSRLVVERASVSLRDLAWQRIAPWQDVIAQFFDDPAMREDLGTIKALEVISGSDAEALYLAGWLGSRLGWTACDRSTFCDRSGRTIPFARSRDGGARRIQRVALDSGGSQFCAQQDEAGEVVCLSVSGEKAREPVCVPLHSLDSASITERAILNSTADELFEAALSLVRNLLG